MSLTSSNKLTNFINENRFIILILIKNNLRSPHQTYTNSLRKHVPTAATLRGAPHRRHTNPLRPPAPTVHHNRRRRSFRCRGGLAPPRQQFHESHGLGSGAAHWRPGLQCVLWGCVRRPGGALVPRRGGQYCV